MRRRAELVAMSSGYGGLQISKASADCADIAIVCKKQKSGRGKSAIKCVNAKCKIMKTVLKSISVQQSHTARIDFTLRMRNLRFTLRIRTVRARIPGSTRRRYTETGLVLYCVCLL